MGGWISEVLSCHLATQRFCRKRPQMDKEGKMVGGEIRSSEGTCPYPVGLPPAGAWATGGHGAGEGSAKQWKASRTQLFSFRGLPRVEPGWKRCPCPLLFPTFSCFPQPLAYCLPYYYRTSLEEMEISARETFACSCLIPKTFCSTTTQSAWPTSRAKTRMKNIWGHRTSRPLLI